MDRFTADELRRHTHDLGMTHAEAGAYIEDHLDAQDRDADRAEAEYLTRELEREP